MSIGTLRKRTLEVTKQAKATESAHAVEEIERALCFGDLAHVVRPALPTICSKVPCGGRGKPSEGGAQDTAWFPWRGVLLCGSLRPVPGKKKIQGLEEMSGKALVMTEDGVLAFVSYYGEHRTGAAGDFVEWHAMATSPAPSAMLTKEKWTPAAALDSLLAELEIQLDGKARAERKSKAITAKLRAAREVLRG